MVIADYCGGSLDMGYIFEVVVPLVLVWDYIFQFIEYKINKCLGFHLFEAVLGNGFALSQNKYL